MTRAGNPVNHDYYYIETSDNVQCVSRGRSGLMIVQYGRSDSQQGATGSCSDGA